MRVNKASLVFLVFLFSLVACEGTNILSKRSPCGRSEDCQTGEICQLGRCAPACVRDENCLQGERCLVSSLGAKCLAKDANKCPETPCPEGAVCTNYACRTLCEASSGLTCLEGQACVGSVCIGNNGNYDPIANDAGKVEIIDATPTKDAIAETIQSCSSNADCSNRGLCGDGQCTCFPGYKGAHCEQCDIGYTGYPDCIKNCPTDYCNKHGSCAENLCSCNPGYAGKQCDQCAPGYIGYPDCKVNCPSNFCNGRGSCSNNICNCNAGYAGETCNQCASGYINYPNCTTNCPANYCNGHGSCNNNTCSCYTGYTGSRCTACASGYIGYPNCTLNCPADYCNGHGSCSSNVCSCYTGYTGSRCTACASGYSGYPSCVRKRCIFYHDQDYTGTALTVYAGQMYNDLHNYNFGDKISSQRCYGGAYAVHYQDKNFTGYSFTFSGDVPNFKSTSVGNVGDFVSSLKVY